MIESKRRVAYFKLEPGPGRRPQRLGKVLRLGRDERTVPFLDAVLCEIFAQIRSEELTTLPESEPLYAKLAVCLCAPRDVALLSQGSGVGIRQVFETYVDAGDEVVYECPLYHPCPRLCACRAARPVVLEYNAEAWLDFHALLAAIRATARLITLANPNGTIATLYSRAQLDAVVAGLAARHTFLVVDDVNDRFHPVTALPLLANYDNRVIARSFCKAFGGARLCVDAFFGHSDLVQQSWNTKRRHKISAVSARIAEYLQDHLDLIMPASGAPVSRWCGLLRRCVRMGSPCCRARVSDARRAPRGRRRRAGRGGAVGGRIPGRRQGLPPSATSVSRWASWEQMAGFVSAAGEELRHLRSAAAIP